MLPLEDRRVLVTRAAGQASSLAAQLESLGATVILIPTIEIAPPASYCALDAALACLRSFDWLIFTSANAVQAFAARARQLGLAPYPRRVAAIGPATAKAALAAGLTVDLTPQQAVAESLAAAMLPHAPGASMLLVRAAIARDILPETLETAGATVTIAEAYRSVIPPGSVEKLGELLSTRPPDAITFTSASIAKNLAALLDTAGLRLPRRTVLASIGPITSQAMRELGLEPTLEAAEANIPALISALALHFAACGSL